MTTFGVPASALGHLYQHRYALLLLLRVTREHPAVELSIERADDIAVDDAGQPLARVQTKHSEPSDEDDTHFALSDSSVDVWKTLRVWAEGLADGSLSLPGTMLLLVSTGTASPGSAAAHLRPQAKNSGRDTTRALELLLAAMDASRSQSNARAYAAFRTLSHAQQQLVVEHVQVLDSSGSIAQLEKELAVEVRYTVDERHANAFLRRLEGWWYARVIEHLRAPMSDRISGVELLRILDDLRPQFHDQNLPIDDELDALTVPGADAARRLFVEQLRLIGTSDESVRLAMIDYYRAFAQRSTWAREDLLHTRELERYEARLLEAWGHAFELMRGGLEPDASEHERRRAGANLYKEMILGRDIRVRRDCDAPFIMRGSFHMLADDNRTSDRRPRLGWHAEFVERLFALLASEEVST